MNPDFVAYSEIGLPFRIDLPAYKECILTVWFLWPWVVFNIIIFNFPQNILPVKVHDTVLELFVPSTKLETAIAEAATLPQLTLNKLDCQWVQVSSGSE